MMEITPVGIGAVLCSFGQTVSDAVNEQAASFARRVTAAALYGVTECVPGYASVLVSFDPLLTDADTVMPQLTALEQGAAQEKHPGREVVLPVCYGGAFGPDLAFVARHTGLTEAEVIRLHSSRAYRIYMLGFLPGFPYLGGLDERLATPRLAEPRAVIPAGSVGIGGRQTGVYPMASPGGWQLIGRTPITLFAPGVSLPYRAGDTIRFVPITPQQFAEMEASGHADGDH